MQDSVDALPIVLAARRRFPREFGLRPGFGTFVFLPPHGTLLSNFVRRGHLTWTSIFVSGDPLQCYLSGVNTFEGGSRTLY